MIKTILFTNTTKRIIAFLLLPLAIGLPVTSPLQLTLLLLLLTALFIKTTALEITTKTLTKLTALFIILLLARLMLPLPQIQAGSNLYLPPIKSNLPHYQQNAWIERGMALPQGLMKPMHSLQVAFGTTLTTVVLLITLTFTHYCR